MSFVKDIVDSITGRGGERAAGQATAAQVAGGQRGIGAITGAGERAQGFLSPFGAVGQQGLEQASFLGDPQAQFDFLQNNPLFQLALENANQGTLAQAAAGGRLSAGDTLQRLSENVLLSASPLIDRQRQDILAQLGIGTGIAGQQSGIEERLGANVANLETGIGAVQAGGIVGAQNARQGGLFGQLGGGIGGGIASGLTNRALGFLGLGG